MSDAIVSYYENWVEDKTTVCQTQLARPIEAQESLKNFNKSMGIYRKMMDTLIPVKEKLEKHRAALDLVPQPISYQSAKEVRYRQLTSLIVQQSLSDQGSATCAPT